MRKSWILPVLLASFLILCLLGLAVLITILKPVKSDSGTAAVQTEAESALSMDEPEGMVITSADTYDAEEAEHSFIFVGDSRTVGMHDALFSGSGSDPCTFIAKSGEGFYWLSHDGIDALEEALVSEPDATVIFNLGVNDLKDAEKYVDFYKEVFAAYSEPSFYIMSVNPVVDEECSGASNAEIESFNEIMQEEFPDRYLDCYNYLLENDFETVDGLHYSGDTYRMIHRFAVDALG